MTPDLRTIAKLRYGYGNDKRATRIGVMFKNGDSAAKAGRQALRAIYLYEPKDKAAEGETDPGEAAQRTKGRRE